MTADEDGGQSGGFDAAPFWVVVSKLNEREYASAAVDAPTEEGAKAEGKRIIASQEGTAEFYIHNIRGPFPKSPGEAASEVRPAGCHGCGLHCWGGENPPCPHSTWFERERVGDGDIAWACIQCGTLTVLPTGAVVE